MGHERDIIADLCACEVLPENGSSCPSHERVPHRTLRRLPTPGRRRLVRRLALGVIAIPAGLLAGARPTAMASVPTEKLLLDGGPSTVVKSNLMIGESGIPFLRLRVKRNPEVQRRNAAVRSIASALGKCRSSLPEKQRWRIARAIEREADRHGYDPLFVQALVEVESTCRPTARSPRGALGLTQVQPATARALAESAGLAWRGAHTLLDPELNLRLGMMYLSQLEERFGDMHLAVAAYNLGPGAVAGMTRERARRSVYVRRVLARYENLLAAAPSSALAA